MTDLPLPDERVLRYTARRASTPPGLDGRLDAACWRDAPRTPRFVDLVTGEPTALDTRAAILWDDDHLYVGFWIEEPHVVATLTERDAPLYTENDVELFIAGRDSYYELEVNALGTVYEALFVWDDAPLSRLVGGAELRAERFDGVGFAHPRGGRTGYFGWDLPGLRVAAHVDETLDEAGSTDRGWTVEVALPWHGLRSLAAPDGRALPPRDGDVWRIDLSRFNAATHTDADSGGWAASAHGVWDSHIPELFPYVTFAR